MRWVDGQAIDRSSVDVAAEDWLRAAGVPKIQLIVRRDNETAAALYRQRGYGDADVDVFARCLDSR